MKSLVLIEINLFILAVFEFRRDRRELFALTAKKGIKRHFNLLNGKSFKIIGFNDFRIFGILYFFNRIRLAQIQLKSVYFKSAD